VQDKSARKIIFAERYEVQEMKKRLYGVLILTLIFMLISPAAMAQPQGKMVSNTLEFTIQVKSTLEALEISELAEVLSAGLYDNFVVSVDRGECGDEIVVGKIEVLDGNADDLELSYLLVEGDNGQWIPIGMDGCWFGYSDGEALKNLADQTEFKIDWKESAGGTYKFAVSFFTGDDGGMFNQEMASCAFEVNVVQGDPVLLTHAFGDDAQSGNGDLTGDPISTTVNAGDEIAYTVEANLANGVRHVDNLLYIIEFEKDSIVVGDFEFIAISGYGEGEIEVINDTFVVDGNRLKGYLGPDTGFKFGENSSIPLPVRTTFTIRFTTAGEYLINIYAIQVGVAS
jgi:hypothetical protein